MALSQVTGPKSSDVDAFSVADFCRRHGFSVQLFYKEKQKGLMPATFRVGTRVLISRESAAEWRARQNVKNVTKTSS